MYVVFDVNERERIELVDPGLPDDRFEAPRHEAEMDAPVPASRDDREYVFVRESIGREDHIPDVPLVDHLPHVVDAPDDLDARHFLPDSPAAGVDEPEHVISVVNPRAELSEDLLCGRPCPDNNRPPAEDCLFCSSLPEQKDGKPPPGKKDEAEQASNQDDPPAEGKVLGEKDGRGDQYVAGRNSTERPVHGEAGRRVQPRHRREEDDERGGDEPYQGIRICRKTEEPPPVDIFTCQKRPDDEGAVEDRNLDRAGQTGERRRRCPQQDAESQEEEYDP